MPEQAIKDKTSIVGIGWTAFTRQSGTTALNLALEASLKAIDDAGLSPKQIDGVFTHYHRHADTASPPQMVHALGLERCNYQLFNNQGGSWNCSAVMTAAALVHAGVVNYALLYRAMNRYSEGRGTRAARAEEVSGEDQFRTPFGNHHAAATFGHVATAHMAKYGTTSLDFAHLAVTERDHALLNTKAMMRPKGPITIEDHQNSRWIVYPFRLLDCCQETDGAVAMVITSAERARDLKQTPIHIMSGVGGTGPTNGPWETNAANAAPLLYEGAGITPRDVDVAEIYDPFTLMCLTHIEDYQLVEKGQAGAWVREGHNKLDGSLPVNTHGGLLSEAHIHGQNHVIEAVQQLRPQGVVDDFCEGPHRFDRSVCRQVRDPKIALVCGEAGGSSMLLRRG
jgi:acetyl-CoA acetyltransferase